MSPPAVAVKDETNFIEAVVETSVVKATQPIARDVQNIQLSVAKMIGSQDEHKDHVHRSLGRIEDSLKKQASKIGHIEGIVNIHEAERQAQSKGEKKSGFHFSPLHLTLALSLGLVVVAVIGHLAGADVIGIFRR